MIKKPNPQTGGGGGVGDGGGGEQGSRPTRADCVRWWRLEREGRRGDGFVAARSCGSHAAT